MSEEELAATIQRLLADALELQSSVRRLVAAVRPLPGLALAQSGARNASAGLDMALASLGYAASSPPPAGCSDEEAKYLKAVARGGPLPPKPVTMECYGLAAEGGAL